MFSFKFGQKEIAFKYFHNQKQLTDIFAIVTNKVVVSECHAIMGKTGSLFYAIKSAGKHSYRCLSKHQNSVCTTLFNVFEVPECVTHYLSIWYEIEYECLNIWYKYLRS